LAVPGTTTTIAVSFATIPYGWLYRNK